MSSRQKILKQNDELKAQLTPENKVYYQDLAEYVRLGSNFKNETKIEELLLQVLQDLIAAQEDGISATEYFGEEPKSSANDLLGSFDTQWVTPIKMFGVVLGTYFFMSFAAADLTIDIIEYIVNAMAITSGLLMIFKLMQKNVYNKEKSKVNSFLIGFLIFLIVILELFFEFSLWVIELPYPPVFGITLITALIVTGLFFKKSKEERTVWLIGMTTLWGALLMGLVNHWVLPMMVSG